MNGFLLSLCEGSEWRKRGQLLPDLLAQIQLRDALGRSKVEESLRE